MSTGSFSGTGPTQNAYSLEVTPPSPDPRVGLRAGLFDAAEAAWNMKVVSATPPPEEFVGITNSDLAFKGNYAIQGNYNGVQVWDISNPTAPTTVTTFVCPASQSDVSVYGNLLFVSGEGMTGRLDCSDEGVQEAVSHDRLRGIRIFDITDIRNPNYLTNVQTCRGSHTHTVLEDPNDQDNVYIYVSGSAPVRPAEELAGCSNELPSDDPNSALFRIEVIKVPLASPEDAEITDFVEKYGILGLIDKFANGLTNLFNVLFRILYPYLFIFIPFGILFSLRPIEQKLKHIKTNWIMILSLIAVLAIPFAIIEERRFLFALFPFVIILSTIPIQRVTNYGLSTFSFNERQKSVFLVIVVGVVLLLSTTFTMKVGEFGYGLPNSVLEHEKIEFTKYLVENFDGRILHDEDVVDYLVYVYLTQEDNADFKEFKSPRGKDPYPDLYEPGKVVWVQVNGKTIEELITNGETIGLKYIGILEKGSYFFPFMNDLYYNEEKYPYMEKIFDSNEMNYKEFKMKAFEINYEKFYLIKNKG